MKCSLLMLPLVALIGACDGTILTGPGIERIEVVKGGR